MNVKKTLRERCRVNTNDEGDRFVGVKADTDGAMIRFPLGYQIPENDNDLRHDISNLLHTLSAFMKEESLIEESKFAAPETVAFPMHAYLKVIRDYLRTRRYYTETEARYKTDVKGNASWARTLRRQRPLMQKNGSLIFTKMTVRSVTPDADQKITRIHRFCVYEAFEKMGWLYVPYMPDPPETRPGIRESIAILEKKLASTHNDVEQELFSAMRSMLKYMDEKNPDRRFSFGTDFFERVWERMIDRAFGIPDKARYFPRTRWILDYGNTKIKTPLQPDSIMIYNGKVYVLDAKFYRYACSGNPDHLPNGPDINKQITYGEYIERAKGVPSERLYNAFIMPFNSTGRRFTRADSNGESLPGVTGVIGNIGEAVGDWKPNPKNYERVQGIVMDTRFLMYHYAAMPDQVKGQLADAIEKVDSRLSIPPSRT